MKTVTAQTDLDVDTNRTGPQIYIRTYCRECDFGAECDWD